MYARVNRSFRDLMEGAERREGEVFELTPERFAEINRKINGYISECDAPGCDAPKAEAKPRSKRRTAANKAKASEDK